MAAQTLVDEAYAKENIKSNNITVGDATATINKADIAKLAELEGKGTIGDVTVQDGKVTKLEYTKKGKKCTYENGEYTVEK